MKCWKIENTFPFGQVLDPAIGNPRIENLFQLILFLGAPAVGLGELYGVSSLRALLRILNHQSLKIWWRDQIVPKDTSGSDASEDIESDVYRGLRESGSGEVFILSNLGGVATIWSFFSDWMIISASSGIRPTSKARKYWFVVANMAAGWSVARLENVVCLKKEREF
jgi:hypothetical protein